MSPPSFFANCLPPPRPISRGTTVKLTRPRQPPASSKCPFSIRALNPTTYLVREHDPYGEYPNIYAKVVTHPHLNKTVIILSDTGCGTSTANADFDPNYAIRSKGPESWTIGTFLEYSINPKNQHPYLVITTHCHYDHILGISHLPPTCLDECCSPSNHSHFPSLSNAGHGRPRSTVDAVHHTKVYDAHLRSRSDAKRPQTTILSSSHSPSFITPYSHLQKHSLCSSVHRSAPVYTVGIWAHDFQRVIYNYVDSETTILNLDTRITILHTPGHTPDSLTWYDENERQISVGDSLYEKCSPDSEEAPWGPEPPMPTMFDEESDLRDWWESLKKVLAFVREKNEDVVESDDEDQVCHSRDSGLGQRVRSDGIDRSGDRGEDTEESMSEEDDQWVLLDHPASSLLSPSSSTDHEVKKFKPRITLSAAHVTVSVDAESALQSVQNFLRRILRNDVPFCELKSERGARVGLWDDDLADTACQRPREAVEKESVGRERITADDDDRGRWSVKSPLRIIEDGRKNIPESEWR